MADSPFSAEHTPFDRLGGELAVKALVERFYDAMDAHEPDLAGLHARDPSGAVSREARDRFALFLTGWLGGPQTYSQLHGHPRLRMRHATVPVSEPFAAAWLRCMRAALSDPDIDPEVRAFLDDKFVDLAAFLRNV